MKVHHRQLGSFAVIQQNVGDTLNMPMSGNRNHWNGVCRLKGCVDADQGLCTLRDQLLAILLYQFWMMSVMRREVEIACVSKVVADAAHHSSVISIPQFRHEDSHR